MNLRRKLMIAGCCVAVFGSCKKDNPAPDNFIFYKVNGVYKTIKPEGYIFGGDGLLIDAGPFMKNEIDMFIDSLPQVRSYNFNPDEAVAAADYYDNNRVHFWSDSGKLVVNSFDGIHIKGSFSFRGRTLTGAPDTVHITEGQFSTNVAYYSSAPDTCVICDSTLGISQRSRLTKHLAGARISIPIRN